MLSSDSGVQMSGSPPHFASVCISELNFLVSVSDTMRCCRGHAMGRAGDNRHCAGRAAQAEPSGPRHYTDSEAVVEELMGREQRQPHSKARKRLARTSLTETI